MNEKPVHARMVWFQFLNKIETHFVLGVGTFFAPIIALIFVNEKASHKMSGSSFKTCGTFNLSNKG